MVAIPPPVPVTIPVLLTVAIAVLLLLHVPPLVAFDNVIVLPRHTVDGPVMMPALAAGLTVSVAVAWQLPIA
jgi:hypothetical protein